MNNINDLSNHPLAADQHNALAEIAELKNKVEALEQLLREAATLIRVMRLDFKPGTEARELLDEFVASMEGRGKQEDGNV